MEELKLLLELVSHLPAMAMWVLVGFFVYKVVVIGSIYGVIKFVAAALFDWLKARKVESVEVRPLIDGISITGTVGELMAQIHRIRGKRCGFGSTYVHRQSIEWLREAIDAKEREDQVADAKRGALKS